MDAPFFFHQTIGGAPIGKADPAVGSGGRIVPLRRGQSLLRIAYRERANVSLLI